MALQEQKPLGMIRSAIAIGAVLLLASILLNIWAIQHAPQQQQKGRFNYMTEGNKAYVVWKPLELEKDLYRQAGYKVAWLDGPAFLKLREVLGPYAAIFELFALRLYGLGTILPLVFFTALFAFCEGRIVYHEKIATFGNLSSTRFRIFALLAVCAFALCFIFLTLPFGSELPGIGAIPLTVDFWGRTFWVTAPYLWAAIFAVLIWSVSHQISANFAREI